MMGAIPAELLEVMKGKVKGELPSPAKADQEDFVDVDLEQLVDESLVEEPTGVHAMILVSGFARSDRGMKRKCNEDAYLVMPDEPVYVVADGMGGHNAGDVASRLAVDVIEEAFKYQKFEGESHPEWPRRGDELVRSIHMANLAVYEASTTDDSLMGMGTTIVAVRFSRNKQRAYIAHVGDSRCYRIRNRQLFQLTEDHTLGNVLGIKGRTAKQLARAVGIHEKVAVDLTVDEPKPMDMYLVVSDGLTKMMDDEAILRTCLETLDLDNLAQALIDESNRLGGRDNITVVAIRVESVQKNV
jgi:protein phosphatase